LNQKLIDTAQIKERTTPMIIYLFITAFIPVLAGFGLLVHGVIHAPVGFEDEAGFHLVKVSAVASAYAGPERRQRRDNGESGFGGRLYSGPLRRAVDFKSLGGMEIPSMGGFA
jgi:hypothetical protein